MQHEDADTTDHGRYALQFARALVRGDFEAAAGMLEYPLRENNSPEQLRKQYEEMVRHYGSPARLGLGFNVAPGELEDEAGWVYCSIEGDTWLEAVTVLVVRHGTTHAIRPIDWFRP